MDKAELLDEVRLEVGALIDQYRQDLDCLFQQVCRHVQSKVENYRGVAVYLAQAFQFVRQYEAGRICLSPNQKFGEGPLSVTAVRGGLYRERNSRYILICLPLYLGQNVYGILVVEANPSSNIQDDDITLFTEICSSLENRIAAYYQLGSDEYDFFEDGPDLA